MFNNAVPYAACRLRRNRARSDGNTDRRSMMVPCTGHRMHHPMCSQLTTGPWATDELDMNRETICRMTPSDRDAYGFMGSSRSGRPGSAKGTWMGIGSPVLWVHGTWFTVGSDRNRRSDTRSISGPWSGSELGRQRHRPVHPCHRPPVPRRRRRHPQERSGSSTTTSSGSPDSNLTVNTNLPPSPYTRPDGSIEIMTV